MLTAIAAAFLGGLILNFMPCVFPVISLKALGLVTHGQDSRQARIEGLAFLGGVVATMLLLAGALLAARSAGSAIGWGFQLQSPLVIAVLALVMLGSALNLMGLFEIGLTAQRLGGVSLPQGGPLSAALTGALAIVVATPCTAPFMAGAIGYALVQPPVGALLIFLALALGFAAPFTVISWVPGFARVLPRPGAWMAIFKRALAFPMLGAAAWLAWVLDQQAGPAALGTLLALAVVVGLVAWLYGLGQERRLSGRSHGLLYGAVTALLVAVAVPLASLPRTSGNDLMASAGAPTAKTAEASPATGTTATSTAPTPWSPQAVADQAGHGRAIFVNFTAAWCITCQVNDKAALSTPAVKDAMARTGTIYMVADSTRYNPDIDHAINELGRGGLPLYVVYPAHGGAPVVLPQLLSPGIVTAALEQAAGQHP